MSWKEIMKAPTQNKDSRFGYRGSREYSAIGDSLMAQIVKDLGLPEKDEEGYEIEYEEDYDYLELDISADIKSPDITITVKPKGKISIYTTDSSSKPVYTFTEDKIIMEDFSANIEIDKTTTLDFEIVDYSNGKLYLELT